MNKIPGYMEVTKNMISKYVDKYILLLAPDCNLECESIHDQENTYYLLGNKVVIPPHYIDFFQWFEEYKKKTDLKPFDVCIGLRIFEHIPIRNIDYFICSLSSILRPKAELNLVVPDMDTCVTELYNEIVSSKPDWFKIMRINFEIFSEGENVYDRHSVFTSRETMKYMLEMEGFFEIVEMDKIYIDTPIISQLYVKAKRV